MVERAGIEAHDDSLEVCNDKSFFGTVYLDMYSGGPALSERFQRSLSKIPNLEVSLVDKPTDEKTRITIFIGKPIPLLGILNQMQLVESVVRDKESIRVVLKNGNLWRG